jgi:tetratricopeptide (TPR) repeat protein
MACRDTDTDVCAGKPVEHWLKRAPGVVGLVCIHLVLVAAVALLSYSNAFHGAFHFDDRPFILQNPEIRDLGNFTDPSKITGGDSSGIGKTRFVSFLTFALNYRLHGYDAAGYRVVNLIIHVLNAFLVYLFVMLTFRTPFLESSHMRRYRFLIAFFSALLFASHPLQTQAVTYITQRFASLMTLFYLLSVILYAVFRFSLKTFKPKALFLYVLCLVTAFLAMKTKENAFTLPLAVALYEFAFFDERLRRKLLFLLPLLLMMLVIPLSFMDMDEPLAEAVADATRTQIEISRWDYLFTQFRVVVTYLRLLIFPVSQVLDYDYPVFGSLFPPQVFFSLLFLASFFAVMIYLHYRSRAGESALRLVAFGGLWFFLTLSVESGFVAMRNVIYEHRVYLPSAGIFAASMTMLFLVLDRFRSMGAQKAAALFLCMVPLVLACAAYSRNKVWENEISLWKDVMVKAPEKERGHYNLGHSYSDKGLFSEAVRHYKSAISLNPDSVSAHMNLGTIYGDRGLMDDAIRHFMTALSISPNSADAHYNLGLTYRKKGRMDKAMEHYRRAAALRPGFIKAQNDLGDVYAVLGDTDNAIRQYTKVLNMTPGDADAHFKLGLAYQNKDSLEKAIKCYIRATALNPGHVEAHCRLGRAYHKKGFVDKAIECYIAALRLKPDDAYTYLDLGLVYLDKGDLGKASRTFREALLIKPDLNRARELLDSI